MASCKPCPPGEACLHLHWWSAGGATDLTLVRNLSFRVSEKGVLTRTSAAALRPEPEDFSPTSLWLNAAELQIGNPAGTFRYPHVWVMSRTGPGELRCSYPNYCPHHHGERSCRYSDPFWVVFIEAEAVVDVWLEYSDCKLGSDYTKWLQSPEVLENWRPRVQAEISRAGTGSAAETQEWSQLSPVHISLVLLQTGFK